MGIRRNDARSDPNRGVSITPLPKHMHPAFRQLCDDLRRHAQSHYSTWKYATHISDGSMVNANAIYWRCVLRYINTLEYLGTTNHDTGLVRRHPARKPRSHR